MKHSLNGFTMLELLVVIAVIALLAALLLPAIQQVREAARRTQCVNNLSQIGIALHNYQMAFECLPPGVSNATRPILSQPDGYHMSWTTQILPYLEERNAYYQIDFREGVYAPVNQTVRNHSLAVLRCPSGFPPIDSNYAGLHHDVEAPIDMHQNGVSFPNSSVRYQDILDGTSHTLFVSEFLSERNFVGNLLGWMSGTRSTLRNVVYNDATTPQTMAYKPHGMGETVPIDQQTGEIRVDYVGGLGSHHNGLVCGLMGDGAVRIISSAINAALLRQFANRHDGELMPEF